MKKTDIPQTAIKKPSRKPYVSEAWLKEDNIGKVGYILDPKNSKVKFND